MDGRITPVQIKEGKLRMFLTFLKNRVHRSMQNSSRWVRKTWLSTCNDSLSLFNGLFLQKSGYRNVTVALQPPYSVRVGKIH